MLSHKDAGHIMIKATTNEKDNVLDIFSGSGTTSVAAKKLKRNSIALEKEGVYISLINKRLKDGK